jgi:hypothetical protein
MTQMRKKPRMTVHFILYFAYINKNRLSPKVKHFIRTNFVFIRLRPPTPAGYGETTPRQVRTPKADVNRL